MLASKSAGYAAPHGLSSFRTQTATATNYSNDFASPTDSEFSVGYDEPETVRNWDKQRVSDWLKSINAGQYVEIFRANDINGSNLMDIDQLVLKEMGVKKIGDRIRIGAQAKQFRYNEYSRKRLSHRESSATIENAMYTPSSSGSPKPLRSGAPTSARGERRAKSETRQEGTQYNTSRTTSRPTSPLYSESDQKGARSVRLGALSPREQSQREQSGTYFSSANGRANETPQTARFMNYVKARGTTSSSHSRAASLVVDTNAAVSGNRQWIRVIYDNARASVFSVEECKSAEEIVLKTLRKGLLNEAHVKSYCFYVLDGTEPNPAYCRRLPESELVRICSDPSRKERERLIFRKIHAGEPEGSQLTSAAAIAVSQLQESAGGNGRNQLKVQQVTGEPLPASSYPQSPTTAAEREKYASASGILQGNELSRSTARPRPRRAKELHGARPPSELVVADPKTYFPDIDEDKIDNLRRMSVRRSQRLSRAQSRLSTASNLSFSSSMEDAPPLPRISDSLWFSGSNAASRARPLSVARSVRPTSAYRESYASSVLDVLDEESDEPDRKSYVSLDESASDSASLAVTDPDGNTVRQSYFDDSASSAHSTDVGTLSERLSQAILEDGEEQDEELVNFLKPEAWEDIKYIRGKLIGQGSFGSVYLALHACTAELMAVKQVELPSTEGTPVDAKKNNMVEALKREIALLRELKHPHIVQYLGSSSDANNLNIFLEYVPGGSIAKMLVDYGSLNENLVTTFVRQILVGLAFLHSKDIIHRDIKGANILVDNHGAVKISDFGISKRVQDSKTLLSESGSAAPKGRGISANRVSLQGSVFWMAPEVVKQTAYTRKADIWSLGCLIVEMLTGSRPHPNMSQLQAIFKIGGKGANGVENDPAPDIPSHASKEAKDFLKRTFAVNHEQRPEAEELLQMPFLTGKA